MAGKIRILVVDDNDAVRRGICAVLRAEIDFEVLCDAASGEQAVMEAALLQPDVVVLDINMPGMDGLTAASRIKKVAPAAEIVFLSQHASSEIVRFALRRAGRGYVLKIDIDVELVAAVRAASEKKPYVSKRATSA
jgi:DNA-binding NarL/FixJ family response regulator